jgi:hypothetical protein
MAKRQPLVADLGDLVENLKATNGLLDRQKKAPMRAPYRLFQ